MVFLIGGWMRSWMVVLSIAVIAGCSSTPQPKPAWLESNYRPAAVRWLGPMVCMNAGLMDARMATAVRDSVQADLNRHSVDNERLNAELKGLQAEKFTPSAAFCNNLALIGQQHLNKVETERARNSSGGSWRDLDDSGRGSNAGGLGVTTCNRVGSQTICNRF